MSFSYGERERPVLFSAPMIRQILAGKKTQTRRLVNGRDTVVGRRFPVGTYLWVRETFALVDGPCFHDGPPNKADESWSPLYRADLDADQVPDVRWFPGIFMPRWTSRILLRITGSRTERLQALTEEDARAEGFPLDGFQPARVRVTHPDGRVETTRMQVMEFTALGAFAHLWDGLNEHRKGASWKANPYVHVVTFERIRP